MILSPVVIPIDSDILDDNLKKKFSILIEYDGKSSLKLLYRGSRNGFQASAFHSCCDNVSDTVTVIKTTGGYIFGGFTAITWNNPQNRGNFKIIYTITFSNFSYILRFFYV